MEKEEVKTKVIDVLCKWSGDEPSFFEGDWVEFDLDAIVSGDYDENSWEILELLNDEFQLEPKLDRCSDCSFFDGSLTILVDKVYEILNN